MALMDGSGGGWTAFHADRAEAWNMLLLVGMRKRIATAAEATAAANAATAAAAAKAASAVLTAAAVAAGAAAAKASGAVAEWLLFHPSAASEASSLWQAVGGAARGFNTPKGAHKKVSRGGREEDWNMHDMKQQPCVLSRNDMV